MKVIADTNLLVRFLVRDHEQQALAAVRVLRAADVIAIPLVCLCELVWVLRRAYGFGRPEIAAAFGVLLEMEKVAIDQPAVDAGLAAINAGADFADGVIAHEGRWLGGETFVSFDRRAVSVIASRGQDARLLA